MLIYGASGAIGTIAVQICKFYGVKVTGVCSNKNLKLVQSLSADKVLDYTNQNTIPAGEEYDFVLDAVGKSKKSQLKKACKKALSSNGKYISVDDGTPKQTIDDLLFLKKLIDKGKLKAVIDQCFPLEKIVEAHRYVDQGHKKGNVIINIA